MGLEYKKCCWNNCENNRKQKKKTIQTDSESTYRYCEYHYPIMKRTGRYELTKYEVEILLLKTNCDLCNREFNRSKKEPKIDHCHKTKKVRGVLCSSCNTGLGLLGDDISSLFNAIKYIKNGS